VQCLNASRPSTMVPGYAVQTVFAPQYAYSVGHKQPSTVVYNGDSQVGFEYRLASNGGPFSCKRLVPFSRPVIWGLNGSLSRWSCGCTLHHYDKKIDVESSKLLPKIVRRQRYAPICEQVNSGQGVTSVRIVVELGKNFRWMVRMQKTATASEME
jgi:hypothetical protein